MKNSIFSNVKVLEIASVLAGPSVGMFFSELGAKVIKFENKHTNGDVTRSWKLPSENKESTISAYFCAVNWKKDYHWVDFLNAEDKKRVIEEIQSADILITNFKKGDDSKFGLDYKTLLKLNPKLIYAAINGFGEESDRVAYDLILQAESGFMSINGTPETEPLKMPVALIDILAGHQLKEGILVALLEREISKKGKKVSVSLFETAVASLANQASNWLMTGEIPQKIGSIHPNISPYGEIFSTKDFQKITFAIGSDKQFENLYKLLGMEAILSSNKFSSNANRVKNRVALAEILSNQIKDFNAEDLIQKCHSKFIPVARINSIKDVFEIPEAKNLILEEEINGIKTKRVKTVIFK